MINMDRTSGTLNICLRIINGLKSIGSKMIEPTAL